MKLDEQLTYAEITRFVEVIFLLAFGVFTMYDRTIKVPAMEERLASHEVRISVVESRLNSIQDTLDRIENAVRKKR